MRYSRYIYILSLAAAVSLGAGRASAFPTSVYAPASVLAEGRWVKISVEESGLYLLSNEQLRRMGFNDPASVRIYGYGGARQADLLSQSNYIDDLPLAPQKATDRGIVFYGVGPYTWERSGSGTNYHREVNVYTTAGYYFVTEVGAGAEPVIITNTTGQAGLGSETPASSVQGRAHHERELVMATEAGPLMVGEDFRNTPQRQFSFALPGLMDEVWMECQFVARNVGNATKLTFTAGGLQLPEVSADNIPATSDSHYVHSSLTTARHTFTTGSEKPETVTLGIKYAASPTVERANLDYLSINYQRTPAIPADGQMEFWANTRAISLSGAGNDLTVWDVTQPTRTAVVDVDLSGGTASWRTSYTAMRAYVAWRGDARLPEPAIVGTVANQNLHADTAAVDMIIVAPAALMSQGERIAALHKATDGIIARVVDAAQIYNEFGSGAADVSAIRKYLKMVYDRSATTDRPLRYALLLGRTTLDNRALAAATRQLGYQTIPAWVNRVARQSMNDNDGLSTDDFIAMLGDNSGSDMGLDDLSIAVGRIPMVSATDGSSIIDKLEQYVTSSKRGGWKNRILILADDEDQGVHLRQADAMASGFLSTPGQQHIIDKVYLDAYHLSSGVYPEARNDMFRVLDEGVAWWFFTGHANNHSWTGEGQLTYSDINSMYLRKLPVVVASTCDFLRWDSDVTSGGEIMYKERYGGALSMISATRPVYISDNGYFLLALGRQLLARDPDGRMRTPGEMYRRSKNNILNPAGQHASNPNRLRFVFMGDPAIPIVTPDNIVTVDDINGSKAGSDSEIIISAMSTPVITGRVTTPTGEAMPDFSGVVFVDIYDATESVVSYGNGNGKEEVFDRRGQKLYSGSARVEGGAFTLKAAMPGMVADNFRPATISLYAVSDDDSVEAVGAYRDFYVFGFDDLAAADNNAPRIDALYLNHDGFHSGDRVNTDPVVMARISDDIGINLSTAGVGRLMTLTIDDYNTRTDVAAYYTPSSDGTASGIISYPLSGLSAGTHTLKLRIFDTSGNHADASVEFLVDEKLAPQIFDVYTDATVARDRANFYVRHDRPESFVEVQIEVFDILGRPVWTGSSRSMCDGSLTAPVTWDLRDSAGRRVQRGVYLYRASISTDRNTFVSSSRRIAVGAE